jgi:biopolymer transport protein ExbD
MDEQPSLNMTPMIDCVFLLLIFFLVGTKFTEMERSIGLTVPQVADNEALVAAPERKVINVYQDGRITLDRKNVTLDELTAQLSSVRSQYEDLGVLVRGDAASVYQHVAEVFNACRKAGIRDLGVAVLPNTPKG